MAHQFTLYQRGKQLAGVQPTVYNVCPTLLCYLGTWLSAPSNVMLKRFVRNSKNGPLVDEVKLTSVNPAYAHIRYPDDRESTVSL